MLFSLGAASVLSCSPEETPIARAVSSSLCVCAMPHLTRYRGLRIFCEFYKFGRGRLINEAGKMATGSSKATPPNTELDEDDLKLLYNTLYRIRKKYASLGIQIGLKKSEIDDIEAHKLDPGKSLLEVLSIGLNKAQPLTWNDIYSALRSECVDEGGLAERIRQKYGHLFIPESRTGSESEQDHEILSEEIERVKKRSPKKQRGSDHQARVSKEQERSSEYEGTETVRSKKHVQEVESEDEEDAVLSRKEKKEKVRRKGAHYQYKEVHDKERPKGRNKKESQSEPEEVVREKSKRKKKATHDKEESVKGYGDRDHYSDGEVSGKARKRSKKHSKKREVYTESESEASSDEDEMENSSFEDDTSQKGSARRKLTKHTQVKIKERYPQKEHRKDEKKKDAKFRDIQYSDEEVSTKSAKKLRKLKKVETESEEESSSTSSSDEEFHKSTKKSKHTETKSAARTKDTAQYESEEKGKTSGKKRVSFKPKSATAEEASHYPEEYKVKGRKKAVRVDERVGKSTDSSRETYHKTRSKPPRKEAEGKREAVSEKKATAPSLEQDLPCSEMAQTDSGDGESDESSEDESVQYPKSLKFEETQSFSHDSDKHVYGKGSVGWKGKYPRTAGVKRSLKSKTRRPYGTQYRKYLQSYYNARVLAPADKYLPTLHTPYINLAMISRGRHDRGERDEFTLKTLHGGIDQILESKSPINIEDLLTPEYQEEITPAYLQGGLTPAHMGVLTPSRLGISTPAHLSGLTPSHLGCLRSTPWDFNTCTHWWFNPFTPWGFNPCTPECFNPFTPGWFNPFTPGWFNPFTPGWFNPCTPWWVNPCTS